MRTFTSLKNTAFGGIFEDKLQKEKTGHVTNKDFLKKQEALTKGYETGRLKHARTEKTRPL